MEDATQIVLEPALEAGASHRQYRDPKEGAGKCEYAGSQFYLPIELYIDPYLLQICLGTQSVQHFEKVE